MVCCVFGSTADLKFEDRASKSSCRSGEGFPAPACFDPGRGQADHKKSAGPKQFVISHRAVKLRSDRLGEVKFVSDLSQTSAALGFIPYSCLFP
jgi:hypothetical protein